MVQLWYSDDEVRKFHPLVEECLNGILTEGKLSDDYAVEHHPTIPGSTKTPDFSIYKKRSKRIVLILEIKRTERDVDSQRYWNQTRGYIRDLTHNWEPGNKYFAISNIEKTISFADRDGPDTACILSGNPLTAGRFAPDTHDADQVLIQFKEMIRPLVISAITDSAPEWADAWQPIIDSFVINLRSSIDALSQGEDEQLGKEIGTYELLRIFLYHFISSYYTYTRSPNVQYFRTSRLSSEPTYAFREMLNNYDKALDLDFKQIFSESPISSTKINPVRFEKMLLYFNSFVDTMSHYIDDAVKQNHSPSYFFNLLTNNLYNHEELHKEGKVMSDSELAGLLAELCVEENSTVLDPGCGDGALLDASYDKLLQIKSQSNPQVTHQEILNQLSGIEIDPFLTQLAAFRLLMKNPHEVNDSTEADILSSDIFKERRSNKYDVVLMNPPFLRNEETVGSLSGPSQDQMIRSIKSVSNDLFVLKARQPNLYFYFINYAFHYLDDDGKMGLILMSKFMNNVDAVYLKSFLLDKVEAIISYPKSYFNDFRVTTSVVILSKLAKSDSIKFLNVKSEPLISNPQKIKSILEGSATEITQSYSLKVVDRTLIKPEENWRTYLLDPEEKYKQISSPQGHVKLSSLFNTIKRGIGANSGGSDIIFPSEKSSLQIVQEVPTEFLTYGLRWNKLKSRHFILDRTDLKEQSAIDFPSSYNKNYKSGYDPLIDNPYFEELYKQAQACPKYAAAWPKILSEAFSAKVPAQIIIPRADRTKHSIYYNSTNEHILVSTNFVVLDDFTADTSNIDKDKQIKFITAYLLSSFGQIQFELIANDQEGMRKIEALMIDKLNVPNPSIIKPELIDSVVDNFDELNDQLLPFSGIEGVETPRKKLDTSIAKVLISLGMDGFENEQKLAKFVQMFLADIVEERLS